MSSLRFASFPDSFLLSQVFSVTTFHRFGALVGILTVVASGLVAHAEEPAVLPARPEEIEFQSLDFKVPEAKQFRRTLADGTVVYVAPSHEFPLVKISITFKGGGVARSGRCSRARGHDRADGARGGHGRVEAG